MGRPAQSTIDRKADFDELQKLGYVVSPYGSPKASRWVQCPACVAMKRYPSSWTISTGKANGRRVGAQAMEWFREHMEKHAAGTVT